MTQSNDEHSFLGCIYTHNGEMLRHFDRLKYTVWTVYTVIIAGLWVAKNAGEITRETMLVITGIASFYFIMLVSRIQRNYKVFFSSSHMIESFVAPSLPEQLDKRTLPFIEAGKQAGKFWEVNSWDRIVGCVPYFHLKMIFFIVIPIGMVIVYLAN